MKNYLITGGAGFIGSSIAKRLITAGNKVVVVDNLRTGCRNNVPTAAKFVELDLRNDGALECLDPRQFDAILHLAAQSSGEISHDDPIYDIHSNALGTLNLLLWGLKGGIKRFLNASTMGLYGHVTPADCPVTEEQHVNPVSFYGVSKLAAEKYCNYFMTCGMQITSFRMFNVYGPGQNIRNMKQGMVSIYLAFLLNKEPIHVKGARDRFRDFIYIDDVVEAWIKAIDNQASYNKVYNLGTGKKTYIFELIENLLNAFGKEPDTYPVYYSGETPADQMGIFANVSALQQDLNWRPKVDLVEGLQKLVDAYHHI